MRATRVTAMLNLDEQMKKMPPDWYWVNCERGYIAYKALDRFDANGRMRGAPTMLEQISIGKTVLSATNWVAPFNILEQTS